MQNNILMAMLALGATVAAGSAAAVEMDDLEITIRVIESNREEAADISHKLELPDFNQGKRQEQGSGEAGEKGRADQHSGEGDDQSGHESAESGELHQGRKDEEHQLSKEDYENNKGGHRDVKEDRDDLKAEYKDLKDERDEAKDDLVKPPEDREELPDREDDR